MKTIITSNWRPLHRALCTLLIGVATLWAMPRSAHAQLYVSEFNFGTVGEYDTTGAVNTNFSIIMGLSDPNAPTVSGDNLFVANAGSNTVGKYDANTGAVINATLIPVTAGLSNPAALAVSGNDLFVANHSGTIGKYNVSTGAVNTTFSTITGLSNPYALALSGNDLFVVNNVSGTVGEYDATTGAPIHANFIQGNAPTGLAVLGNNLFLANTFGGSTVSEYDATTGNVINANFITGLGDSIVGLDVASVPEPSTWAMIAVGGVALVGIMLRKKNRSA